MPAFETPANRWTLAARRCPALLSCLVLFLINAVICWPLFSTEYLLDGFRSNEGTFITFGRFLLNYWPNSSWFPWFNAGMPFENTYLPLVPMLVAAASFVSRCSPAHAFHFLAAFAYSLAPPFLFLFARKLSGRMWPSFWAALAWSIFSPSVVIPQLLADMRSPWGSRRLLNIVYWGEMPHNVALCLLPLALLFLVRFLEVPTARRFVVCVAAVAAVMLSNAFGGVVVSICAVMLVAARQERSWTQIIPAGVVLAASYLLICRYLPPSLIGLIRTNSRQLAGGDPRFNTTLLAILFTIALIAIAAITLRLPNVMLRFAVLFTACFGGITVLGFSKIPGFVPQPQRYHLEMELGICLLAAFALDLLLGRVPRKYCLVLAAICAIPVSWILLKDCRAARRLIHPVKDMAHSYPVQQAQWIDTHLPGQRVLIAGENQWWFNIFSNNPQLSAGHEPSAPNWMQRVAVYTIYSGMNAGDQDGPISVVWLKAFGCGAITVPGAASGDYYHPIAHPKKFDGLLPLVWRSGDDSIYQVPLRSTSLAHVIPQSAIVSRQPVHGLDIDPVRPYVAALDDPALPLASIAWTNPDRGQIHATVGPNQVVSVQITYDAGWQARVAGHPQRVRPDQLGLIIIDANCAKGCVIDLEYTGGWERRICRAIACGVGILLLGMMLWGGRYAGSRVVRLEVHG